MMTIKINGSDVAVDFGEILTDADPRTLAGWGWHLAEAQLERDKADASYRAWKAREGANGKKKGEPEWKVKQKIESSPNFMAYKEGIALANFNVALLSHLVEAIKLAVARATK